MLDLCMRVTNSLACISGYACMSDLRTIILNVLCCAKWNINLCRSVFQRAAVDVVAAAQPVW